MPVAVVPSLKDVLSYNVSVSVSVTSQLVYEGTSAITNYVQIYNYSGDTENILVYIFKIFEGLLYWLMYYTFNIIYIIRKFLLIIKINAIFTKILNYSFLLSAITAYV